MNNSFDNIQSDTIDFEAREAHEAQQEQDFDPARDTDLVHDVQQDTKWLMGGIVWRRQKIHYLFFGVAVDTLGYADCDYCGFEATSDSDCCENCGEFFAEPLEEVQFIDCKF